MNKIKTAFSLIEISIVILIVGIVIAGITQSSRLVAAFKLNSARTLTKNSPVAKIDGLIMWLDSTSEESFVENEDQDSASITTWYDINPSSTTKHSPVQADIASQPKYKASAINNLPALQFDGVGQYLAITYDQALNPQQFTLFAVASTASYSSSEAIISSIDSSFSPLGYALYAETSGSHEFWVGNGSVWSGSGVISNSITLGKPNLLTCSYNGSSRNFYNNGTSLTSASVSFLPNATYNLHVGASNAAGPANAFYNGYIGEIILFNRALKIEERTAIEDYLRKKWSITD